MSTGAHIQPECRCHDCGDWIQEYDLFERLPICRTPVCQECWKAIMDAYQKKVKESVGER